MRQIASPDQDRLEFRSGGGCLTFFGLPFLGAGLFVMSLPWTTSSAQWQGGQQAPWFFLVPFGAIFALVGAALSFGRRGAVLDRRQGLLITWWGLLVPFRTKQRKLEADAVRLNTEVRRSDKSTYTVYPVRLQYRGKAFYTVGEPQVMKEARASAEQMAKFLNIPLEDETAGTKVVRAPDELDMSLRERLQKKGEDAKELPPQPENLRAAYDADGDSLLVTVPPTGLTVIHKIAVVVLLGVGLLGGALLLGFSAFGSGGPSFFDWIMAAFMAFPVLGMVASILHSAKKSTELRASPDGLELVELGLRRKKRFMPVNELEELLITSVVGMQKSGQGPGLGAFLGGMDKETVVARSDKDTFTFGSGLSREELEWLKALIEKALTR